MNLLGAFVHDSIWTDEIEFFSFNSCTLKTWTVFQGMELNLKPEINLSNGKLDLWANVAQADDYIVRLGY